jgi:hypothetical protein
LLDPCLDQPISRIEEAFGTKPSLNLSLSISFRAGPLDFVAVDGKSALNPILLHGSGLRSVQSRRKNKRGYAL